jgi:radical SAM protein with 4Fe4S-binding SPASM domain
MLVNIAMQEHHKFYTLSKSIKLRQEYFGGIVFNTRTGAIAEVDREAFVLLTEMRAQGSITFNPAGETNFRYCSTGKLRLQTLKILLDLGIIEPAHNTSTLDGSVFPDTTASIQAISKMTSWPAGPYLSAPETVHWAITYQCDSHCEDCYIARNYYQYAVEMDTREALQTVDILADWGIFQLAIGGGEPLLRPNLPVIVKYARENGLSVHITTGKDHLETSLLKKLAAGVTCLQLGIKPERLLTRPDLEVPNLSRLVQEVKDLGMQPGANLIIQRTSLNHFTHLVELLTEIGFMRIVLLRYKPPAKVARWQDEKPTPELLLDLERLLSQLCLVYPHIQFRVDCALSFLQRHLKPDTASLAGIYGCAAAQRILAIAPDGSVFPCSQLVQPCFQAGNIRHDNPAVLWSQAKVLKTYRSFRDKTSFKQSQCGICPASKYCGGCRVFAHDALGVDPGCPDPLSPPSRLLGKAGRRVDLEEYFQHHGEISVIQYMERYGVGQESAVRELKATKYLSKSDPKAIGRKMTDHYMLLEEDLVRDIQDTIGYTDGGFPYASREEIIDWLGLEDNSDYPRWLHEIK